MIGNIENKIENNSRKDIAELRDFIDYLKALKTNDKKKKNESFDIEKAEVYIKTFERAVKALEILDKLKLAQATSCDPMVYGHAAIDILEDTDKKWREYVYSTYEKVVSTGNRLDREEVMDTILAHCKGSEEDKVYQAIIDEIADMKVETSTWIMTEKGAFNFYCERCGGGSKMSTGFCPHCGMKMNGVKENK